MSSVRLALAIGLVVPLATFSQDSSKLHFIRVSGEATVKGQANHVAISIGVLTQAPSADAASLQNADQSQTVLASLKAVLSNSGEVQTAGYTLSPQYDYSNGHSPRLLGYQASNTFLVSLNDIALAGKVIDSATNSGANNIGNVEFTVRDRSALYAEALTEAARNARTNAETIAKALGLNIAGILQVEPQEPQLIIPRPMAATVAAARMSAVETPFETAPVEVRASVVVSFEVR